MRNTQATTRGQGNVRELRFAIERAVVMCHGDRITVRDLPQSARGDEPAGGGAGAAHLLDSGRF